FFAATIISPLTPRRSLPVPTGGYISAAETFRHYCHRGEKHRRFGRTAVCSVIYILSLVGIFYGRGQVPQRLCIPGSVWHILDLWLLLSAVCLTVFILFLALDASNLTAQMLRHLTGTPTKWPRRVLVEFAREKMVFPGHIAGWLDVHFAA